MSENNNLEQLKNKAVLNSSWKEKFESSIVNEEVEDFLFELSVRILERMDELKWNKTRLASELGVSKQYVTKLLRAKENLGAHQIFKISNVLGIKLIQLVPVTRKQATVTLTFQRKEVDLQQKPIETPNFSYSNSKHVITKWPKETQPVCSARC